ncbi:hypothetical protein [Cerasicoccus arenae]|uniref:Uncharacterized protein n=1 Tax=Cerasicoccus arenae TaxID=424488 RepID=A0A8J3GCV8_9BACT|nr:hypothetical protein [Cerasicoccus arenae]MBK1857100.1 hypothetical protein [Cerasicoccus arenae]GHB92370.1 hypothetical protein GCM10007047_04330 [Cerasicoccus arenae]
MLDARPLDWGGSINAVNLQSDLTTPLDSTYVFYLGSFGPFDPTSENVDEWAEHWTTVDAVSYNPSYGVFNARHDVTSSDPTGEQGYIWGVRRTRQNMEWILISDPNWTWPADGALEQKVNWMVSSATETIVGYINGSGYQMVTSPVNDNTPIPVISYDLWVKRFFPDGDVNADPEADPNGNNLDNLAEFALDANPVQSNTGDRFSPSVYHSPSESGLPEIEQGNYLGVIVQPSLDADVQVLGWLSPDITFSENVSAAVIETLSDGSLLIRDPVAFGPTNARKFIRIEFREPS